MATGTFERELKGILTGDEAIIRRVTKTCDAIERDNYLKITERPFVVIRAAGSLGVDLVALRGEMSFPIEVKTSVNDTVHFSDSGGRAHQQAEDMRLMCESAGLVPLYAFRLKKVRGDSWRVYTLETEGVQGRLRMVHSRLPKLSVSRSGKYVLRWDEGWPLNEFLGYVVHMLG